LAVLEKEYSLITRHKPLFSKPESRNIRWKIGDNYLRFYFRFIYPNQALIETGRNELLLELIRENYETYSGLTLEQYFMDRITEEGRVTLAGSWWDKKGENEIDLVALSSLEPKGEGSPGKTALIAEVKRNPKKINLGSLAEKAEKIKANMADYRIEYRWLSLMDM
jgi:AAA+ ATPase superfamily predicted ATPase